MRIEICGGIAAGKTTLANLLGRAGYSPVIENFRMNPFWTAFYAEPGSYAFETEITFLLQHYHELKVSERGEAGIVADFSVVLDLAYATMGLADGQRTAFDAVCREVQCELGPPDLLIHLDCPPSVELGRIKARRRTEEAAISMDFLSRLNTAIVECVRHAGATTNVLRIDSNEIDFAESADGRREAIDLVLGASA